MSWRAFAFAVVKVSSNTSLLGDPTLNQLYTRALNIGLWNSIENDLIMVAACLPSTRPLLKACKVFAQTHMSLLTSFKPRRRISSSDSQHSLKGSNEREVIDESMLEMGTIKANIQAPKGRGRSIQVRHEILLPSKRKESDGSNTGWGIPE